MNITEKPTMPNVARYASIAAIFLLSNGSANADISEQVLWRKLDSLGDGVPLSRERFESALGTRTFIYNRGTHITTWRGEPVVLGSDLGIATSEIKFRNDGSFSNASLDITGKCITFEQIKANYGNLTIFDMPKGHSVMDEMVYRSRQK